MKVAILYETGARPALFGLGLSYGLTSGMIYDNFQRNDLGEKLFDIAGRLAGKDGGHDKFLRYMVLYLDCTMPRYWWQEADTYKVGTVAQSESTMHTIHKRDLTLDDFEFDTEGIYQPLQIDTLNALRQKYVETKDKKYWRMLIQSLPQSFLQRRIWMVNYGVLRNIFTNRKDHRLKEWNYFLDTIRATCKHPEFLP